jgi:diacylglycerol kinase (ATP)
MFNKAMLVYNASAGQAELGSQLGAVMGELAPQIGELALMGTKQPGDAERFCRERAADYDLLLILGGDGTVHECINGIAPLADAPVIGILPGGTCNDFSRMLGLPQELDQAARTLMQGNTRRIDIGRVNDRYFTNFVGIGLITDASENINPQLKERIGKLSYLLSTVQTLKSAEPFRFTMKHERGQEDGEAVMIFVANGRYLGTRELPIPEVAAADGCLDVAVVREAGLPLLKDLLKMKNLQEWESGTETIEITRVKELLLTTERPMRADTDGEIYMETPLSISVLERKLAFLIGEAD